MTVITTKTDTPNICVHSQLGDCDEIYCDWFNCPACGDGYIMHESNYCPGCGRKIEWVNDDEHQR